MPNLNQITIIGHCGRDPESRYLPNGDAMTGTSVAVSETWTDKSGQKQERTEWFNVSFFGRTAEIASQYLKKGDPVFIQGRQRTEKWTKDGVERQAVKLIADRMLLLGGRREQQHAGKSEPAKEKGEPARNAFADMQDDIPL